MGKQMFELFYMGEAQNHQCQRSRRLHFSTEASEKVDDSWVWINGQLYKVVEVSPDGRVLHCREIRPIPLCTVDAGVDLPWELVGVHEVSNLERELSPTVETIEAADVEGKALLLEDRFLMAFPKEWMLIF